MAIATGHGGIGPVAVGAVQRPIRIDCRPDDLESAEDGALQIQCVIYCSRYILQSTYC